MKHNIIIRYAIGAAAALTCMTSCFNLDEKVFDRVDASVFYEDESSVKGAVAAIYEAASRGYAEYFYYLNEFSADQIAWRVWNGGLWGYDEGLKFQLSIQEWSPESTIIKQAWETAWTTIGLANNVINDLENITPSSVGMTEESIAPYIAEVRTLRAWAYYNVFEVWGGALPLYATVSSEVPPSADADFDKGCQKIYDFIASELDESWESLPKNSINRMNQASNRMIKMRLLLNSGVFTGTERFTECATLAQEILDGTYGTYSLARDWRDIYGMNNNECSENIMAFAFEYGYSNSAALNMRNVPGFPYNFKDILGCASSDASGWNCTIIAPSHDNSGTVLTTGGTTGSKSFVTDYGDKLGAVYDRFDDRDIRKKPFHCNTDGTWEGLFLMGAQTDYHSGEPVSADADRDGQDLVYVDQVGQFLEQARPLETVMSPRWGETNSGYRLVRYPVYPDEVGFDYRDADEVEFRLAEVYYTLAECKLRAGDSDGAKALVNDVRSRYFSSSDWNTVKDEPGPGFTAFDLDWMLNEWGKEFLGEGRRRRTDLRRFDKFTQGQWWFFGRAENYQATRDRKYEWFPLPASALLVNPGLVQNPDYVAQ